MSRYLLHPSNPENFEDVLILRLSAVKNKCEYLLTWVFSKRFITFVEYYLKIPLS